MLALQGRKWRVPQGKQSVTEAHKCQEAKHTLELFVSILPTSAWDRGRNRRYTFQCLLGPWLRELLGSFFLVFLAVCSRSTRWPSAGLCSLTVRWKFGRAYGRVLPSDIARLCVFTETSSKLAGFSIMDTLHINQHNETMHIIQHNGTLHIWQALRRDLLGYRESAQQWSATLKDGAKWNNSQCQEIAAAAVYRHRRQSSSQH